MKKIVLILIAGLGINACGFQLAAKANLDPMFAQTHIDYQIDTAAMADLLAAQFRANDMQLVDITDASAKLKLLYEKKSKEILSVDENGKVREYELILQVGIKLSDADGEVIIRNQEIRLSRDFLFEINDVLGKSSEREQIYQEMREDIARLIIYRLQAISSLTAE